MSRYFSELIAAKHFNVHSRTIANWIGKGFIHGSRVGSSQMASAMPIEKVAPGEGVTF